LIKLGGAKIFVFALAINVKYVIIQLMNLYPGGYETNSTPNGMKPAQIPATDFSSSHLGIFFAWFSSPDNSYPK